MGVRLAHLIRESKHDFVMGAWLETLPKSPISPPIGCPETVLEDIRDKFIRTEAINLRIGISQAFEVHSQPPDVSFFSSVELTTKNTSLWFHEHSLL